MRIFAHNFALDMAEFMRLTHAKFTENGRRFRACVGSCSSAVESILSEALYRAKVPFLDLRSRLEVSVTRFAPWPVHVVVGSFQDKRSISVDTVLASCYLPVAYESPKTGFCGDDCALQFPPKAQCG